MGGKIRNISDTNIVNNHVTDSYLAKKFALSANIQIEQAENENAEASRQLLSNWSTTIGAQVKSVKTPEDFSALVDRLVRDTENTLFKIKEKGGTDEDLRAAIQCMKNYINVDVQIIRRSIEDGAFICKCVDEEVDSLKLPSLLQDPKDSIFEKKIRENIPNTWNNRWMGVRADDVVTAVTAGCNAKLNAWARYLIDNAYRKVTGKGLQ